MAPIASDRAHLPDAHRDGDVPVRAARGGAAPARGRRRAGDRLRQGRPERADRPAHPAGARREPHRAVELPARAGPPRAPRGGRPLVRAALRRGARPRHGGRADARLERGDLQPRAGARRPARQAARRLYRARLPGLRARRPLRRRRAACPPAPGGERLPSRPRHGGRGDVAPHGDPLGELPQQPDRRDGAARLLPACGGARGSVGFRARLRRGVHRALVRRAAGVGAPGAGPQPGRRLPDALEALVDDGLSVGVRRRRPRGDRGAEGVPADGRHGAAGVRAARVDRRVGRRGARRARARDLPAQARDPPRRARTARIPRRGEPRGVGPFEYLDKIPLKRDYARLGVRVVPPATARYGSFLSPGVVMMPSYVNIGAWVGPRTMVDTWATVGSCAQIGADVHLAGGVGIGGVLEPVNARPVIVEDGAFLGSRCIVTEGVVIGEGAVLGPNVVLTASVPVIDVTGEEPVEHRGYVPPRSVVLPGTRPREFPAGTYNLACALIVGRRKESTDLKLSLNEALREHGIGA